MAATAAPGSGRTAAEALQKVWERRGPASHALLPLSAAFAGATALRRVLYRHGWLHAARLPVPVVVVGNLVVGGAGKTPAVIAIVDLLRRHGFTPGIVSRGYGRSDTRIVEVTAQTPVAAAGDEPLVLARRCGVPVVVGADRVAAGHALLQAHVGVDVVISDDGLQHLALERDVEVVLIDERGAGNGRLLPAGPLRQPLPAALEARQLVLYNAEAATTALPGFRGRRRLRGVTALADWWRGEGETKPLASLHGRRVVAVAALARPERFFAMLRAEGLDIVPIALPDHDGFTALPWPAGTGDVVVTEKDAVKLAPERRLNARVWVATLDFEPEPRFASALLALLPAPFVGPRPDPHGNPSA